MFGNVITAVGSSDDYAYSVTLQPDGKILVAGESRQGGDYNMALTRYNADGSLDTSFGGGDGIVTTDLGSGQDDTVNSITLQPDGKILLAGSLEVGGDCDFVLARYTSTGSLDTSFGLGGIVATDFAFGGDDRAVGRTLEINGTSRRVVGVLPRGFVLPTEFGSPNPAELFIPMARTYSTQPGAGNQNFNLVARLSPGASVEQADQNVKQVMAHIREQFALSLGSCGRPRMTEELKELGLDVGHRRATLNIQTNQSADARQRENPADLTRTCLRVFAQDQGMTAAGPPQAVQYLADIRLADVGQLQDQPADNHIGNRHAYDIASFQLSPE